MDEAGGGDGGRWDVKWWAARRNHWQAGGADEGALARWRGRAKRGGRRVLTSGVYPSARGSERRWRGLELGERKWVGSYLAQRSGRNSKLVFEFPKSSWVFS